ncbi:hypothetical protein HPP92_026982 [Vanilla planifolia]|uniref:Adenylate isopentenyltransferase n=1 Tax=Vanilla planifolia TaxID=51239 RepID=A0A835PGP2_VANPL|nr:hypothetical protein HPP92_027125 [Vanilla planifolia]KAG0450012.1 hypothetical protein HPP92_026982 [Vanilla planifolia]
MGATGTGKSKLSIDIASRFPTEVVNADKIQVYRGLDVTTNKIPLADRCGVPHHLLGEIDPAEGELQPAGFRALAGASVAGIAARGRIPVVVGGSNSCIYAMMVDRYDGRENPFSGAPAGWRQHRYRSCLIWVDVEASTLAEQLDRRVDEMVGKGMVEELEGYFNEEGPAMERHLGLAKAIGVPEFRKYFQRRTATAYEEALASVRTNTRRLAEEQLRKIKRLKELGWRMQRMDATAAVAAGIAGSSPSMAAQAWERDVVGPSLSAVEQFLREET